MSLPQRLLKLFILFNFLFFLFVSSQSANYFFESTTESFEKTWEETPRVLIDSFVFLQHFQSALNRRTDLFFTPKVIINDSVNGSSWLLASLELCETSPPVLFL
jgi:hypothetical protein